jgi:TonB family protein
MILTSLVLLPVMAHAAANASTEPQPFTSSVNVKADQPKAAAPVEMAAADIAIKAVVPGLGTSNHAAIRQFVQTKMTESFVDAALRQGGTLEFAMMGSVPAHTSAPQVTQAVSVDVTAQDLAERPTVSSIVLHAIVDENGVPRNVQISQSAGTVIDRKAVAAVSQYRFKPATYDNKPTWAPISITIKIEKP